MREGRGNTELTPEQAVRYWRNRAENAEREVERQRELMEATGPLPPAEGERWA